MMLTERILSRELDGKYRDVLELCLYNAVLGGGSLDGKGFSYANKLATYGDESALRAGWFEGTSMTGVGLRYISRAYQLHMSLLSLNGCSVLLSAKPVQDARHFTGIHMVHSCAA